MVAESITPWVAFAAGLLSFFAPCVLPVVPAYLSFITGGPATRWPVRAIRTGSFVAGFSGAFIALGLLVGALSTSGAFASSQQVLERVGGALIIFLGLVMTRLIRVPWLDREVRFHGRLDGQAMPTLAAFFLGAAFAVGWSPCVGPVLASVLLLAGMEQSTGRAALLLATYSAGLAIPFLALGLSADRGVSFVKRFAGVTRTVEIVGGALLIILGIVVFTGAAARLTSWFVPGGP